jgi:alpha-L-rhamnosidase
MLIPYDLSLEFLASSLGVAPISLRFCWKLRLVPGSSGVRQTAYRLRAATTLESCLGESPDLWDSGRVGSDETLYVPYAGRSLQPFAIVHWSVTVWDENGIASAPVPASEPFTVAPMSEADWSARWIGATAWDQPGPTPAWFRGKLGHGAPDFDPTEEAPAIYLRKNFLARRPVQKALLSICGLGCYVASVNGKRVSACLEWPLSAYDKTVLFRTFDATSEVTAGENALCAILGNGLYHLLVPDFFSYEKAPWRGSPRMICHLHLRYDDGSTESISSDESWRVSTDGPIRYTDMRGGETIDARRDLGDWQHSGFDDSKWAAAIVAAAPRGRLEPDPTPRLAVREERPPSRIEELPDGTIVVDFGGPLAGFIHLKVRGQTTGVISARFGEALNPDGSLDLQANTSHTYGRYQLDRFLPSGHTNPETFETTFSRHAFRFVQIEGLDQTLVPGDILAFRITNTLRPTGFFNCSDPLLNQYHEAARRTLEDCTAGLPCAEPVREKIAWAGDMTFLQPAYCYLFDSAAMYRRTADELASSQAACGHLPPVHPCGGWGRLDDAGAHEFCDDAWWGGSLAESAAALALHYGDPDAEKRSADAATRYVDYLAGTREPDGCVNWGLGDWCDREWKDGRAGLTEVAFTATLGLRRLATLASDYFDRQNRPDAALRYRKLAEETEQAVRCRYWREGGFDASSQTMQALPITLGLLSGNEREEAERRFLADIESLGGRLSVGFIGLVPSLRLLADLDRADLALRALLHVPDSGLRLCLECSGAPPTLGETIHARLIDVHSGAGSFHHQFGATATAFIYEGLAGLRPDPAVPGWKHFFVRPALGCGLQQMNLTYESPRGMIGVAWNHKGPVCHLTIEIPANTSASLRVAKEFGGTRELGPGIHGFKLPAEFSAPHPR